MAIVPMRQIVTIQRDGTGELDRWGNPVNTQPITLKCRVDEGSQITSSRSSGVIKSEEDVATARILIDKLADIRYTDTVSFTNELGETIKRKPKEINVKRHISGKPILTEVIV
ncbi:hypothetical protein [Bacillus paralicheniformis]|uniref:hypothetical protein n=1 Tax=Bacillus paralicheniformis TaxID=1648923 RepID=UPI00224396EE|nr:hypothetical protein [Bacillus paralicheniformis]MEC1023572.1 hypothetical protein [Bacillus paralicheniformis]MEC1027440.1 hypothetical protein [Bacillus paralicheniformis]MEC1034404.1 hypothetical protein [Bacillus paralicheniformis]MEC1050213.1 hypothetical protein [Bacillus paralicheniformis]MEC1059849.1 hypothetical protein [Bacillus paralicheniformis]